MGTTPVQPRHFSNLLPGIYSAPAARVAAANALLDRGYGKQAAAEELRWPPLREMTTKTSCRILCDMEECILLRRRICRKQIRQIVS
jgi:hypothetical protein